MFLLGAKQKRLIMPPGVVPLLLLLVWIGLQLVPLPPEIVKVLSPVAYEMFQDTLLVVQPASWLCLSLDRLATIDELYRLSSYALFYLMVVQVLANKRALPRAIFLLALLVGVVSLLAAFQKFTTPDRLLWIRAASESAMGPWFNRDHFSGFVAMLVPLVFGIFLYSKPKKLAFNGVKNRVTYLAGSARVRYQFLYGVILVSAGFALILGKCRATFLVLPLAMTFFFLMTLGLTRRRRISFLFGAMLILLILAVSWSHLDLLLNRFAVFSDVEGVVQDARWLIWQNCLDMVRAFPVFGAGFNAFSSVYPGFQDSLAEVMFYHAHNDVLELLIEGGVAAFVLVVWFLGAVVKSVLGAVRQQDDEYLLFVTIGALTGMSCLVLHSFVDFSFRVYCNGLLFFLLCAVAVVASRGKMHEKLHVALPSVPRKMRQVFILGGLVLAVGSGWFNLARSGTELPGDTYARFIGAVTEKTYVKKQENGRSDNSSFGCWLPEWNAGEEQLSRYAQGQVDCALRLQPLNGDFLHTAGRWYINVGQDDVKGEALLQAAGRYGVFRYRYLVNYAAWLFSIDEDSRALISVDKAMRISPQAVPAAAALLHLQGKSFEDIGLLLPPKSLVYEYYCRWLEKQGEKELAGQLAVRGMQLLETRREGKLFNFIRVHRYLLRAGRLEEALDALYLGLDHRSADFWLHLVLGDYFRTTGNREEAIRAYDRAGTIRPGHAKVTERLRLLQ